MHDWRRKGERRVVWYKSRGVTRVTIIVRNEVTSVNNNMNGKLKLRIMDNLERRIWIFCFVLKWCTDGKNFPANLFIGGLGFFTVDLCR